MAAEKPVQQAEARSKFANEPKLHLQNNRHAQNVTAQDLPYAERTGSDRQETQYPDKFLTERSTFGPHGPRHKYSMTYHDRGDNRKANRCKATVALALYSGEASPAVVDCSAVAAASANRSLLATDLLQEHWQ
jgi:hypothetical protein